MRTEHKQNTDCCVFVSVRHASSGWTLIHRSSQMVEHRLVTVYYRAVLFMFASVNLVSVVRAIDEPNSHRLRLRWRFERKRWTASSATTVLPPGDGRWTPGYDSTDPGNMDCKFQTKNSRFFYGGWCSLLSADALITTERTCRPPYTIWDTQLNDRVTDSLWRHRVIDRSRPETRQSSRMEYTYIESSIVMTYVGYSRLYLRKVWVRWAGGLGRTPKTVAHG